MQIIDALLSISNYNRPGTKRANTTAIACHYIGNPGTSAQANRNWFESLKDGKGTSASCHYIIGLEGEILRLVPENEISWCTDLCKRWKLDPLHGGLIRHYDVTYKVCPKWFADNPEAWGQFNIQVILIIRKSYT